MIEIALKRKKHQENITEGLTLLLLLLLLIRAKIQIFIIIIIKSIASGRRCRMMKEEMLMKQKEDYYSVMAI